MLPGAREATCVQELAGQAGWDQEMISSHLAVSFQHPLLVKLNIVPIGTGSI